MKSDAERAKAFAKGRRSGQLDTIERIEALLLKHKFDREYSAGPVFAALREWKKQLNGEPEPSKPTLPRPFCSTWCPAYGDDRCAYEGARSGPNCVGSICGAWERGERPAQRK